METFNHHRLLSSADGKHSEEFRRVTGVDLDSNVIILEIIPRWSTTNVTSFRIMTVIIAISNRRPARPCNDHFA